MKVKIALAACICVIFILSAALLLLLLNRNHTPTVDPPVKPSTYEGQPWTYWSAQLKNDMAQPTRLKAVTALGALARNHPNAIDALFDGLADGDSVVKDACAAALAHQNIPVNQLLVGLKRCVSDQSPEMHNRALRILEGRGLSAASARPTIEPLLVGGNAEVMNRAFHLSVALTPESHLDDFLFELIKKYRETARGGDFGEDEERDFTRRQEQNQMTVYTWGAPLLALTSRLEKSAKARRHLLALTLGNDAFLAWVSVKMLTTGSPVDFRVDALTQALRSPFARVQVEACGQLGALAPRSATALPDLIRLTKLPADSAVAKSAAEVVNSIEGQFELPGARTFQRVHAKCKVTLDGRVFMIGEAVDRKTGQPIIPDSASIQLTLVGDPVELPQNLKPEVVFELIELQTKLPPIRVGLSNPLYLSIVLNKAEWESYRDSQPVVLVLSPVKEENMWALPMPAISHDKNVVLVLTAEGKVCERRATPVPPIATYHSKGQNLGGHIPVRLELHPGERVLRDFSSYSVVPRLDAGPGNPQRMPKIN